MHVAQTISLGLAAALTLSTVPSAAGDAQEAKILLQVGLDRFTHQDYEGARDAFARAYDRDPAASTLFNLALAELQSDHVLEAARHLHAYLTSPDALPDKIAAIRSKLLPRAESHLGHLEIAAPQGAELAIDGVAQPGHAPFDAVDVAPGEHEIAVHLGAQSWSAHVALREGETQSLHFDAAAATPPPPSAAPEVAKAIEAHPSAPEAPTSTPAGPQPARVITVLLLGTAAVAATATGVVFGAMSNSNSSDAARIRAGISPDACGAVPPASICSQLHDTVDAANSDYWSSVGFYIAGGTLAAAAAATWFLWPKRKPSSAQGWSVTPLMDARGAGALLSGSF